MSFLKLEIKSNTKLSFGVIKAEEIDKFVKLISESLPFVLRYRSANVA